MTGTSTYNLPDIQLLNKETSQFLIWIPDKSYLVLGASNRAEESLFIDNVTRDDITVLKRPSGGQAVLLTPNNLIIAAVFVDPTAFQPKDIFHNLNSMILSAMEKSGIKELSLMGISDIAIAGKKILGSSIYRNQNRMLYHAVLNVSEPSATFEKYLKHPVKEPDYRHGRNHTNFVTSLKEKGYTQSQSQLSKALTKTFEIAFSCSSDNSKASEE